MTLPPHVETDPDIVGSFLSDAAHVGGGFAAGVAFPATVAEVSRLVASAHAVLPVGAQSSLTGGATPRGELVLSTRGLDAIAIDPPDLTVRLGAGVPLARLQSALAVHGLWYPPAPTFDGAFIGGTVSTNAAGAATFKYGTTRDWVVGLTVVLADGEVLTMRRGEILAVAGTLAVPRAGGVQLVPVPRYGMPNVPKLSAGYFARPGMDLVDLFVGSEGTLAVIADVTVKVMRRPQRSVALVACDDDAQALALVGALRDQAHMAWKGNGALDVSAIEYMDARSLSFVSDDSFRRAGLPRASGAAVALLVQMETRGDAEPALDALDRALADAAVHTDPVVALPGDEAAAARLFELREAVPAAVNAAIAVHKQTDSAIEKTAGDFIVPFEYLPESVALYHRVFESRGLSYAIWGHVSDGNLHPNVIPRTRAELDAGREALVEAAQAVIALGGSPLAEHGVGRSAMKQRLLRDLYGERGIDEMRAVKRVLDPEGKLARGVLFS